MDMRKMPKLYVAAALLLFAALFAGCGKENIGNADADGSAASGSALVQSLMPSHEPLPLPTVEPSPPPLFENAQAFTHSGIGVSVQAPEDFAISSYKRSLLLERGKGTRIFISFGYNSEYAFYNIEEYKAHLQENLQSDLTVLGCARERPLQHDGDIEPRKGILCLRAGAFSGRGAHTRQAAKSERRRIRAELFP